MADGAAEGEDWAAAAAAVEAAAAAVKVVKAAEALAEALAAAAGAVTAAAESALAQLAAVNGGGGCRRRPPLLQSIFLQELKVTSVISICGILIIYFNGLANNIGNEYKIHAWMVIAGYILFYHLGKANEVFMMKPEVGNYEGALRRVLLGYSVSAIILIILIVYFPQLQLPNQLIQLHKTKNISFFVMVLMCTSFINAIRGFHIASMILLTPYPQGLPKIKTILILFGMILLPLHGIPPFLKQSL